MHPVIAIALCNCAIAMAILAIALWVVRFRRTVIAVAECCERWEQDCARLLAPALEVVALSGDSAKPRLSQHIDEIRQIYRQQLQTIERIQSLRFVFGIARSLIFKRGIRG